MTIAHNNKTYVLDPEAAIAAGFLKPQSRRVTIDDVKFGEIFKWGSFKAVATCVERMSIKYTVFEAQDIRAIGRDLNIYVSKQSFSYYEISIFRNGEWIKNVEN